MTPRAVLNLLWGTAPVDGAAINWSRIDRIARQHRLRPLLHQRVRAGAINPPPGLASEWERAWQRSAIRALQRRAELTRIGAVLAAHGATALLLKGGAIAWRGWFDPALRPMRDLDLLLEPEAATRIHNALSAAGYRPTAPAPAHHDAAAKHLPGLAAPESGVVLELHTRLWDTRSEAGGAAEEAFRRRMLAGAVSLLDLPAHIAAPDDGCALLHVIVHGVLDHQFNNGPLLLFDIAELVRHGTIDWPPLWRAAEEAGAVRAVQLGLALAEDLLVDLPIAWGDHRPAGLDRARLDAAAGLLLVDLTSKTELGLLGRIARLSWRDWAGEIRRGLARRQRRGAPGGPGGLRSAYATLRDPAARGHVADSLAVAAWLRGP